MTRTRLLPAVAAVAAAVLLSLPTRAAEPADPAKDDLKAVRDLLAKIEQRLATQQTTAEVLTDIVKTDVKNLRDEVARLQRELTDLRNRPATPTTSASLYGGPPSASLSIGPPAPTARVRLVNTYFAEMSALVNGTLVTVPPGQERLVTVPAGVMNFQVFQVAGPLQTRTLVANETLTLTLRPV
jgi:hypothetical protein